MAMLDGYQCRKEDNEDTLAYFTCHIMNLMGKELKQQITPAELLEPLRKPKQQRDAKADKEYFENDFGMQR